MKRMALFKPMASLASWGQAKKGDRVTAYDQSGKTIEGSLYCHTKASFTLGGADGVERLKINWCLETRNSIPVTIPVV